MLKKTEKTGFSEGLAGFFTAILATALIPYMPPEIAAEVSGHLILGVVTVAAWIGRQFFKKAEASGE